MRKFLGKVFGTFELFTKYLIEYEWDDEVGQMIKKGEPIRYPAYISIVKRQKVVRLIMDAEYAFMMDARASNSVKEAFQANNYVLDNPTESYEIIDYGKQSGNDVYITKGKYGFGECKFLILGESVTQFYDLDTSKNHYSKSKSFMNK